VIQRHVPAIGDNAVDEFQLSRLKRQRSLALVERFYRAADGVGIILSKMLSSWIAIVPSRHPVQPK